MNSVNTVGSEARALFTSPFCHDILLSAPFTSPFVFLITAALILFFFFGQMSHFVLAPWFLLLSGSVFPHPSTALQNALSTVLYMAKAVRILPSFPLLTDMCPGILHPGSFVLMCLVGLWSNLPL